MPDTTPLKLTVNGRAVDTAVDPATLLVDLLRGPLGLTGTHVGCDTSQCGACTVLLDGRAVKSCTVLAVQAAGRAVTTVEGLAATDSGEVSALQQSFIDHGAAQCGICTPGMLMAAADLLARQPHPDAAAVRDALGGVLCRCTGYQKIVEAVLDAARDSDTAPAGVASAAPPGSPSTSAGRSPVTSPCWWSHASLRPSLARSSNR